MLFVVYNGICVHNGRGLSHYHHSYGGIGRTEEAGGMEEIAAVVMESLTVHDQVEGEDRSRKALKVKCVCVCVCVRGFVCVCFVSVCICVSLCVCSVASYKSTCACR